MTVERIVPALCLLLLAATPAGAQSTVPVSAFADAAAWTPHPDGGRAVQIAGDATPYGPGLRLRYADAAPHWGNVEGPCSLPGRAVALRLRVEVHRASQRAAMYVWLLQPNGDAWESQALFDGKPAGGATPGWHDVGLPLGAFDFQPRGPGKRRMTSCARMLIGCNYGDLDMTVADMRWDLASGAGTMPLPRRSPAVERGRRGSVAVLDLGGALPGGYRSADAPARFAKALREGGFGATVIGAGDLADPAYLTPAHFDAVVLPYGPFFPAAARDAFIAYLKAGGSFLSTGGYAFDRPVVWDGARWIEAGAAATADDLSSGQTPPGAMNTRFGVRGDAMTFSEEQIGVFDPADELTDVHALRLAPGFAEPGKPAPQWRGVSHVAGFSATGLIGANSPVYPPVYRRWKPVIQAVDATGALRGTVLAVMHNFTGVYRGSSWAFSGLISGDDLLLGTPARRRLLWRVMDEIVGKVVLHGLASDLACYRPGETATIRVTATNFGRRPEQAALTLTIGKQAAPERRFTLQPGVSTTRTLRVPIAKASPGYVPVRADLRCADGVADRMETAFCVWNERIAARGPRLAFSGNYLTVDGRPTIIAGTNQTGMMFFSAHEDSATWEADFSRMAALDIHLLRILHFSPFADLKGGNKPAILAHRPEKLRRQLDAIVQIAQKHRIAICLTLHDWMDVALTDEELREEADWDRFWSARYRGVPGVMFDVQNEPSVEVPDRPDIVALWNAWLRQRYGTDAALRAAWWKDPPDAAMPNVPLGKRTGDWSDVRSADLKRFETALLNRWLHANVEGVKAGNPNALVLVGYLPSMSPADKALGAKWTDISNTHYYGPVSGFPTELKFSDRRFAGKGLSVGEFGAQEAHDDRVAGIAGQPVAASVSRFHLMTHDVAGLGGAFLANWDWKDFDEMEFPWGLVHREGGVPKPWALTYAQDALFLSFVQPHYESPGVFLVLPDANRIGPHFGELDDAIRRSSDLLLNANVDFGVIDEEHLAQLPLSARLLFWPLPYCPDDATFGRVLRWVHDGGVLYFSGSVAFDHDRKPTRTRRYQQLGLDGGLDGGLAVDPWATPESAWGAQPVVGSCGSGVVVYAPYPLELRPRPGDAAVYALAIGAAGFAPHAMTPADAPVRVMAQPTTDGGRLIVLARRDDAATSVTVTLPDCGATVTLGQSGCAFVRTNAAGEVCAAESDGALRLGGQVIVEASGHFGVVALDGRDLRATQQALVLPELAADVRISGMAGVRGGDLAVDRPGGAFRRTGGLGGAIRAEAAGQVAVVAARGELPQAIAAVRRRMEVR